jgi:hypothetical protein
VRLQESAVLRLRQAFVLPVAPGDLFTYLSQLKTQSALVALPNFRPRQMCVEPDHVELVSLTVQPGEEIIVGWSFREILNGGRRRA